MNTDFTSQASQLANPSPPPNQMVTYKIDEQGSLIICPVVYVADINTDTKISVLGFIEEQNGSETPFLRQNLIGQKVLIKPHEPSRLKS